MPITQTTIENFASFVLPIIYCSFFLIKHCKANFIHYDISSANYISIHPFKNMDMFYIRISPFLHVKQS